VQVHRQVRQIAADRFGLNLRLGVWDEVRNWLIPAA
jgi:hypothetical protein